MAVTLRDIAKRLNLSHATVSFVLNERHDVAIPDTTRKRVMEAAREMGYRPNRAARALVMGRTQMLAIWIPAPSTSSYAHLLTALSHECSLTRHQVVLSNAGFEEDGGRPFDWPVDGVIAVDTADVLPDSRPVANLPTVAVGTRPDAGVDQILIDLSVGVSEACQYLIDKGASKLLYVSEDYATEAGLRGNQAFKRVAIGAGKSADQLTCRDGLAESGYLAMNNYITQFGAPEGVIVESIDLAHGCLRALNEHAVAMPSTTKLIAYGTKEDAEFSTPSISTIEVSFAEVAHQAVDLLQLRLKDPDGDPVQQVVHPRLTLRETA